jgi:hypothetical protein
MRALDDQIDVFEEYGAHWTTWTYKDIGVMGWVGVQPQSDYMRALAPVLEAKRLLGVDSWLSSGSLARDMVENLARYAEQVIADPDIDTRANLRYLGQAALSGYVAGLMQPAYAKCFQGLSETELDRVLQSFAFENCHPHQGLIDTIKRHTARQTARQA